MSAARNPRPSRERRGAKPPARTAESQARAHPAQRQKEKALFEEQSFPKFRVESGGN